MTVQPDIAAARTRLLGRLRAVVGRRSLLVDPAATRRYRTGFRFGGGAALAVVRPGSLTELWRVFKVCAEAGVILIPQASNTGLTGGSTPDGDAYDRDVVILSTRRLRGLRLIRDNRQVICLPGANLYELEALVASVGREPHSRIGSSCIGASIIGGVCNNSGGALIHRGPAYTQMALYGRIDASGRAELVNHLGLNLGDDPEMILNRLESGDYGDADFTTEGDLQASDPDYQTHLREVDAATPARLNNDPRRLFEAAGSGGHLVVFAVGLDTFPRAPETADFYIGSNDPANLNLIRRVILESFADLPVQGEYIHRSAFDLTARYGKDTFLAIQKLGPRWLPKLLALKARADAVFAGLPLVTDGLADQVVQTVVDLLPDHLPWRLRDFNARYEHHLILRMPGPAITETRALLAGLFPSVRGTLLSARATRVSAPSCIASPSRAPRSATRRCTRARSRPSSPSTWRCDATTTTGTSSCPRRSPRGSRASATAPTSSAASSIATISSSPARIRWSSSTPYGGSWTPGAPNIRPSTMSAASIRPSRRSSPTTGRSTRRTASTLEPARPRNTSDGVDRHILRETLMVQFVRFKDGGGIGLAVDAGDGYRAIRAGDADWPGDLPDLIVGGADLAAVAERFRDAAPIDLARTTRCRRFPPPERFSAWD